MILTIHCVGDIVVELAYTLNVDNYAVLHVGCNNLRLDDFLGYRHVLNRVQMQLDRGIFVNGEFDWSNHIANISGEIDVYMVAIGPLIFLTTSAEDGLMCWLMISKL